MFIRTQSIQGVLLAVLFIAAPSVQADEFVSCESADSRYRSCTLPNAGFVTLERQLSKTACRQGRTWDYNRREIWVDDGCRAEFRVHSNRPSDRNDARVAAGVVIGAAILGALAHNADRDQSRYNDTRYEGARHTSYVPGWMIGTFDGYNALHNAQVSMTISDDGRMSARANGQMLYGWINDDLLHVGDEIFHIDQTREGFVTSQVGDRENEVRYRRVR